MKGELIAWRAWKLKDGALHSVVRECVWEGPHMRAETVTTVPKATNLYAISFGGNAPGLHFYRRRRVLMATPQYVEDVVGACALYGHIIEHERGYRTTEAIVRFLQVRRDLATDDVLNGLSRRYGCSVVPGDWAPHSYITINWPNLSFAPQPGGALWLTSDASLKSSIFPAPEPSPSPSPATNLSEPPTGKPSFLRRLFRRKDVA